MNTLTPGAQIALLRETGHSWYEIGQRLGTSENAARHTYRRYVAAGTGPTQPPHPVESPAPSAREAGRGGSVYSDVPPSGAGRDRPGNRSVTAVKTEIEMARSAIAKVTRAEIRLRYSLLADEELNRALKERLTEFDRAVQDGIIPSLALRLVTDG